MKPEENSSGGGGGGGGGSRAAKKRAKKKKQKSKNNELPPKEEEEPPRMEEEEKKSKKKKKRPMDDEAAETSDNHRSAKAGGILKKSKYAAKATTAEKEKDEEGLSERMLEESSANDVELPEEIQELLKSNQVQLRDVLLLDNDKKKPKPKDEQEASEEGDDDENPFQQLTSKERARCALNLLLAPADLTAEDFYEEYWEQKPLYVSAKDHRTRLDGFLGLKPLRKWTQQHTLFYGRDLNVTRYHTVVPGQAKKRANIDPPPYQDSKTGETNHVQADSEFVWDQFDNHQATLRLLCPHKQHDDVHALLSLLELEWGCMVGANAYLTPPGSSQGFAPHYDDIEAFCLQLEGRKRWKVYAPAKEDRLPRVSSEDFTEEDMADQEPVLDVVLEPGDFLYMPRGWIHQGITLAGNEHSLHLTVSAMQQWAWVDYLEVLLPEALEAAAHSETSTSLRQGLPRNFLEYMGAMHDLRDSDTLPDKLKLEGGNNNNNKAPEGSSEKDKAAEEEEDTDEREAEERKRVEKLQEKFRDEAKRRIMRVAKEAMDMVDAACDQIGKRFLSDRLPPGLAPEEKACTNEGQKEEKIWPTTLCRLARPGIARLCLEDGKAILYHCNDNSRVYHEVPLSPMEFEVDDAPALEQLITTVEPNWIPISELIHEGMEDKIAIAQSLYDEGILAIINPDGGAM